MHTYQQKNIDIAHYALIYSAHLFFPFAVGGATVLRKAELDILLRPFCPFAGSIFTQSV